MYVEGEWRRWLLARPDGRCRRLSKVQESRFATDWDFHHRDTGAQRKNHRVKLLYFYVFVLCELGDSVVSFISYFIYHKNMGERALAQLAIVVSGLEPLGVSMVRTREQYRDKAEGGGLPSRSGAHRPWDNGGLFL